MPVYICVYVYVSISHCASVPLDGSRVFYLIYNIHTSHVWKLTVFDDAHPVNMQNNGRSICTGPTGDSWRGAAFY